MKRRYPAIAFGDAVKQVQREHGSREMGRRLENMEWEDSELRQQEQALIASLDHFYMASLTESGWPYLQYRGGPRGFVRMLDSKTLGFADFRGNRQYISTGNVLRDDRVSLFFLDQGRRRRLKVFARAEVVPLTHELWERLGDSTYPAVIERAFLFRVEAFDWNCPQHITPRFSAEELRALDPAILKAVLGGEPCEDSE